MEQWFSIPKITQAMGISEQAVRKQAKNWEGGRKRQGAKGKEYPFDQCPAHVQVALLKLQVNETNAANKASIIPTEIVVVDPIGCSPNTSVDAKHGQRIDAKLEILRAFERFCNEVGKPQGLKVLDCYEEFDKRYQGCEIEVSKETRELYPKAPRSTLKYWQLVLKKQGINALGGGYGNRKGQTKINLDQEMHDLVVGMLVQYAHCDATHIWKGLKARFGEENIPSKKSVQRWIRSWKAENQEIFTALTNPDEWKSKYMAAFGSHSEGIERLNQLWQADSTLSDLQLEDGRYCLIGVLDVYSRRAKLHVAKTSKATAISALLRRALLEWGIPEAIKTDNGKDYTSNHIRRVLAGLDIEHILCPPFQPWHKPYIERFFRTFAHDLIELLPGYCGHDVAERKALEARKSFADRLMKRGETVEIRMTAAELQEFCDRWCQGYLYREHDGLNGKTPFQVLTEFRGTRRTIGDERALDILLAEAPDRDGIRTVQKQGIQLNNDWFIAPELEACIRQQVKVLYAPLDLGKMYVFGQEGFICIAECPRLTGMNRQEVARKAKELQTKRVQEARKTVKKISKTAKTSEIVEEILKQEQEAADKLIPFPQTVQIHDTGDLRAAADAISAMEQDEQQSYAFAEEYSAESAWLNAVESERQARACLQTC